MIDVKTGHGVKMTYGLERERQQISLYTRWLGIFFLCLIVGTLHISFVGSLLKIIAIIPVIIWLIGRHGIHFSRIVVASCLFVLWIALSCLWAIDIDASISRTISQISLILLLFSASSYRYSEYEINYLKKCMIWSSRITAVSVLLSSSYLEGRIYLNGIVREDPNYLCAYFAFAVVFSLMSLISGVAKGKQKLLYTIELILYSYIILGTGSRGGLFAIAVAVAVVIIFTRSKDNKPSHLFKRLGIVALLFITVYIATRFIEKDILLRFTLQNIESSNGAGRYDIWASAFNAFSESSFIRKVVGYGTGTARSITYLFPFPRHNVIHNMFIENLLEVGIVGLILYIMHIAAFLFAAIKSKNIYCIAVISCMITLSLSTSIYTFKPYWNIMIFILCMGRQLTLETRYRY